MEETPRSALLRRIHDLRAAHQDFSTITDLIADQYEFEAVERKAAVEQLRRSLSILDREIQLLEKSSQSGNEPSGS